MIFFIHSFQINVAEKMKINRIQTFLDIRAAIYSLLLLLTVVGDCVNTMKTTFDFHFDLYQAVKQHEHT